MRAWFALLSLLACGSGDTVATPVADAPEAVVDAPEVVADAPEPVADAPEVPRAHPGTVVFVGADGREESRPVAEVPESIAWYDGAGGRVPVVRVVRSGPDGYAEIKRYGPSGELLDVTRQAPPRPAPDRSVPLMKVGEPSELSGPLGAEALVKGLEAGDAALRACVAGAEDPDEAERALIVVGLSIGPDGVVQQSAVVQSTASAAVGECVSREVGGLRFRVAEGVTEARVPLYFKRPR